MTTRRYSPGGQKPTGWSCRATTTRETSSDRKPFISSLKVTDAAPARASAQTPRRGAIKSHPRPPTKSFFMYGGDEDPRRFDGYGRFTTEGEVIRTSHDAWSAKAVAARIPTPRMVLSVKSKLPPMISSRRNDCCTYTEQKSEAQETLELVRLLARRAIAAKRVRDHAVDRA